MERELRARGEVGAVVWNLGMDGAAFAQIERLAARELDALAPTRVIVNSVVNNAYGAAPDMRAPLERLVRAIAQRGVPLMLVKEPSLEPIYGTHRWATVMPYLEVLESVAREHRVQIVDPLPSFRAHRGEFLFMDDVHLTPRGHRLLASILADALP